MHRGFAVDIIEYYLLLQLELSNPQLSLFVGLCWAGCELCCKQKNQLQLCVAL